MTHEEYKRAIELLIEMAQDGCVILSETDKQILKIFAENK